MWQNFPKVLLIKKELFGPALHPNLRSILQICLSFPPAEYIFIISPIGIVCVCVMHCTHVVFTQFEVYSCRKLDLWPDVQKKKERHWKER